MLYYKLRDSRGMTLVEIMMAIAVFGLIIIMFTSSVSGYYNVNNDNLDYIRMAELARAEIEKIKAGVAGPYPTESFSIYYPPGADATNAEQTYKAMYASETIDNPAYPNLTGQFVKIAVAPENSTNPLSDLEGYMLAYWIPSTAIDPTVDESSETTSPAQPYEPGNWVDINEDDYSAEYWNISPESNSISRTNVSGAGQGHADTSNYIFYDHPFNTFDFTTCSTFSCIASNNTGTGLAIKCGPDKYVFYITNGGGNNLNDPPKVTLNFTKNGVTQNPSSEPELFPLYTGVTLKSADLYPTPETYYLRAVGAADGTLKLSFGIYNKTAAGEDRYNQKFSTTFPSPYFDPTKSYLLGLFDETAGSTNSTFELPSSSGSGGCNMH